MRRVYTIISLALLLVLGSCSAKKEPVILTPLQESIISTIDYINSSLSEYLSSMPVPDSKEDLGKLSSEEIIAQMSEIASRGDKDALVNYSAKLLKNSPMDSAAIIWNTFSAFCKQGQMSEALDYYHMGDNSFKILTALYHSTLRFTFDTEVLWPIMVTCSDEDPREEFLDVLLMEKALQDMSLVGNPSDVYVPETYSDLLIQTGHLLTALGKLDDALHMSEDMQKAATLATGSPLVGKVTAVRFESNMLCLASRQDDAIANLQKTMNELIASTPKKNAEEHEEMIDLLRQEINGIRELLED